jgi:hypothetical protein
MKTTIDRLSTVTHRASVPAHRGFLVDAILACLGDFA